jgi:hypothetical protein
MIGDVMALARVLALFAKPQHRAICRQALEKTHVADKYRKRLGRLHPRWGDGSLMGFSLRAFPRAGRDDFGDQAYCDAFQTALDALRLWRLEQARRNGSCT